MPKVKVIDILMTSQVESEMAPHLKVNYILELLTVRSFMLLGKSAHFAHFFAPSSCTMQAFYTLRNHGRESIKIFCVLVMPIVVK